MFRRINPLLFLQLLLVLALIVMSMATGVLLLSHDGLSLEVIQALVIVGALIALMLLTERLTTGRWTRWSRRR